MPEEESDNHSSLIEQNDPACEENARRRAAEQELDGAILFFCLIAVFLGTFFLSRSYLSDRTSHWSTAFGRSLAYQNVPFIKRHLVEPFLEFGPMRPILEDIEVETSAERSGRSYAIRFTNGWIGNPYRLRYVLFSFFSSFLIPVAFLFLITNGLRWFFRVTADIDVFMYDLRRLPEYDKNTMTRRTVLGFIIIATFFIAYMSLMSSFASVVYDWFRPVPPEVIASGTGSWGEEIVVRYSDGTASTTSSRNTQTGPTMFLTVMLGFIAVPVALSQVLRIFGLLTPKFMTARIEKCLSPDTLLRFEAWFCRVDNERVKLIIGSILVGSALAWDTILDIWRGARAFLFALLEAGLWDTVFGGVRLVQNNSGSLLFSNGHHAVADAEKHGVPILAALITLGAAIVVAYSLATYFVLRLSTPSLARLLRKYLGRETLVPRVEQGWKNEYGVSFAIIFGFLLPALIFSGYLLDWFVHPLLEFGPKSVWEGVTAVMYDNDIVYFSNGIAAKAKSWWKWPIVLAVRLAIVYGLFIAFKKFAYPKLRDKILASLSPRERE